MGVVGARETVRVLAQEGQTGRERVSEGGWRKGGKGGGQRSIVLVARGEVTRGSMEVWGVGSGQGESSFLIDEGTSYA